VGVVAPPKGFRLSLHLRQTLCILNDGHRGWAVLHKGLFSCVEAILSRTC
jgi:hypothetical protein